MTCIKCKSQIPDNSLYCNLCGKKQTAVAPAKNTKSRGNGTGSVYKLPSGKWRVAVTLGYDSAGKRVYKTKSGFKTKKEALEYIPKLSQSRAKKKTITIYEAYKAIAPKLDKLSDKRRSSYSKSYTRVKHIEHCNVDELDLSDLQAVIDDIDGGYYTKRYVKDLLSKIFNYAFADGKVDRNLVPYIELPPNIPQKEKTVFSKAEVDKLWKSWNNGNKFAGYILVLIYCGIRTGELWSIKTNSVNFEKHVMYGGIKNAKGKYAPIFIVSEIEPVIQRFVRDNPNGTLWNESSVSFYKNWRVFKEEMKFRKELEPYSGRHTCATILAKAGLPEAVIMNITRHEKYDTTLKYTHIDIESTLSRMTEALEKEL